MVSKKCALVLEGGGLRGAYSAGALSWLIDNNIEFAVSYGISTGAVYLCCYDMKAKDKLLDFSTDGIADKRYMFLPAILRSGKIVDYDFLFNHILEKEKHFDLTPLKNCKADTYIGLYDLAEGKTVYHNARNASINLLKAATSLPILGKLVKIDGKEFFDGGITDMIPIEKAVSDGCEKFLVITTKPENYVRKPAKKAIVKLMKKMYPQCKKISEDYAIRHINYKKQIDLIKKLSEEKKAVFCFPTRESKVTRLGGSKEDLKDLYDLGYEDMERRKESILSLISE